MWCGERAQIFPAFSEIFKSGSSSSLHECGVARKKLCLPHVAYQRTRTKPVGGGAIPLVGLPEGEALLIHTTGYQTSLRRVCNGYRTHVR